jgi:hypothetical protein
MPILIILGWLIILGCFVYLATDVARNRLSERRERKFAAKKIQAFKKHNHYDEKRRQWMRNRDDADLSDASDDIQRNAMSFGHLILVVWELFWVVEIVTAPGLSEIPYFFLLVMMIGVPLAFRMLMRSIQRFAATV